MRADPSGPAPPFGAWGVLEIQADGGGVRCHVCGWAFANLPVHARRTHGLSPDEYRSRFGLDSRASLVAPVLARRRAELARERAEALRHARRRRSGVPATPTASQRRAAERAQRYAALVAAGQTLQAIADREGVTRQAVSAVLRGHGYAVRDLRAQS